MTERKRDIPIQTRLASLNSVDLEARTVNLTWSTGAQVRRTDFWTGRRYIEELSLSSDHVDLKRLNSGAPLLDSHANYQLRNVVGVVESAVIDGNEGRATVRFSKRADVEPILRDVQDGIIRNVSVGYSVRKYDVIEKEGTLPIYRAIDWEPMELSLVAIGADAGAGVRSMDAAMSRTNSCEFFYSSADAESNREVIMDNVQQKETAVPQTVNADAIRAEAIANERQRITDIRTAVRAGKLADIIADKLINEGASADQARAFVLNELANASQAVETRAAAGVQTVVDETETRRDAISIAIMHRYNPAIQLREDAREYRGMSLLDVARECVERSGTKTRGMSKLDISKRAFLTTSDFPGILANVANKTLRAGYESAPRTFTGWSRQTTAPDFKSIQRTQLGDAPAYELVNESGEFKRGTVGEGKETYSLATYGKIVALTRQAIINDDLSAFTRLPELMGRAAADFESDTVYAILTANAALINDSVTLFHSTHGNLAGSGTAISVTSLDVARAAMRVQKGIAGRPINITPQFLIVPAAKETLAQQYTSADFVSAQASNINPFKSALTVVVEPRLDASSTTAWYISASPAQVDTVEYCYLEGQTGVFLETREGFDIDGMELKGRLDFAAKAIDYRGLYKNPGA